MLLVVVWARHVLVIIITLEEFIPLDVVLRWRLRHLMLMILWLGLDLWLGLHLSLWLGLGLFPWLGRQEHLALRF